MNSSSRWLVAIGLCVLTGCGGGGGSSPPIADAPAGSPANPGAQTPAPAAPAQPTAPDTGADEDKPLIVEPALASEIADADFDGLPDGIDPYPLLPPEPAGGSTPLEIDRAHTKVDGMNIADTVVAGSALHLSGRGFDRPGAGPWLIFDTRLGKIALTPGVEADGSLSVSPPPFAVGVYLVIGNTRSPRIPLEYLDSNAPLIYTEATSVRAGDRLRLSGRLLEGIDRLLLGSTALAIEDRTEAFIDIRVPLQADGYQLQAFAGSRASNRLTLDVRRDVTVTVSADVAALTGRSLTGFLDGGTVQLMPGGEVTLALRAYEPSVQYFDITNAGGQTWFNGVAAVVWPDQDEAGVSLASSLAAELFSFRSQFSPVWNEARDQLESLLALPLASSYIVALTDYLSLGRAFDRFGQQQALLAGITVAADSASPKAIRKTVSLQETWTGGVQAAGTGFAVTNGQLDEALGVSVTLDGADKPDTPGSEYSQIRITEHTALEIPFVSGCDLGNKPLPGGIWPSDLCINNANQHYASVAVYQPDTFTYRSGYTPQAADQVRAHVTGPFDRALIIGAGDYLTTDGGLPLCRMETCYVSILTSGLGLAAKRVELTAQEAALVTVLRKRWLLTKVIVPLVVKLAALPSGVDTDSSQDGPLKTAAICLADKIYQDPAFTQAIGDFAAGIDRIPYQFEDQQTAYLLAFGDNFNKTLGGYLTGRLEGNIGNLNDVYDCLKDLRPTQEIVQAIDLNLAPLASGVRGVNAVYKVYDLIKNVQELGGLLLTPEKVLFKMTYRAEITNVSRSEIDLLDVLSFDELIIDGTWLIDDGVTLPDGPIYPDLVFADRTGREKKFRLGPENIELRTGAQFNERTIAISLLELGFRSEGFESLPEFRGGLNDLASGELQMRLEIDYGGHVGYPLDKLPVFSPEKITLRTEPKLRRFDPQGATQGITVKGIGDRLGRYPNPVVTFLPANADIDDLARAVGSPASAQVVNGQLRFVVPTDVPEGRWRIRLADSQDEAPPILSRSQFEVTARPLPSVTLSDFGVSGDDELRLDLLDTGFVPISNFAAVVPDAQGGITSTLLWGENTGAQYIRVECINPGSDQTCTFAIRTRNASVALPMGTEVSRIEGGQLLAGEFIDYVIVSD